MAKRVGRNGARGRVQPARALSDANLVVSGATAAMLFVGRFAFLPFQRKSIEKAGRPRQNDQDYYEAGDVRAAEAFSVMKTNDPVGFNLVDGAFVA